MMQPTTILPRPGAGPLPMPKGAGLTHRGRVRTQNDDAILADPSHVLWAVADGMGGHEGGAVAADLVIDALAAIQDQADPPEALEDAIERANTIVRIAARERGAQVMGATVVALFIAQGVAHVAWAGDSRAYLLRGQRLRMLTHDHTVVQASTSRSRRASTPSRSTSSSSTPRSSATPRAR